MKSIAELHQLFLKSSGACTDTRNIIEGSMFFALKGANFDGNQFAEQAIADGAKCAIVDDEKAWGDDSVIVVDDVLKTLQNLANYHRTYLNIPIIGITGTNGKTSTKELVNAVLCKGLNVCATKGNLNNHIGVPLTLLSMDEKIEVGVVEMGANHVGEIAELCAIAQPNCGIITNVGKAHIEGFGSFEGVKKAKSELYRFIESVNGTLFVNGENQHLKSMLDVGATIISYGSVGVDNVSCKEISNHPLLSFIAKVGEKDMRLSTHLIGAYNIENVLAAISIGMYFNIDVSDIKAAIELYVPSNNRSQLIKTATNQILLDAYNANPSSMALALANFIKLDHQNKVLVIGEMKELGESSIEEHQNIIDTIIKEDFSQVFLLGTSFSQVSCSDGSFAVFSTTLDLINYLKDHPIKDSFVFIKGSRSNKLEDVVKYL
ncbi:UDP-N-acetylmuramoyl-tripeptide--D-alanyl-D-alanine ligase [Saccharicrinis aurantiacus]|uniref:UDP-N-acetylmuramoyl-tripeptide--D-alanyl-D- alanine ligase n=1 Tax=Saccharicrinis aurantiacus TaxID=1849719 RepID=UPI00094F942B|nr:UDP-N-acetylmuramoyl-tripeptide--D-alanyl-D-alanine ligase [Saccharicrinis aurantiacus]